MILGKDFGEYLIFALAQFFYFTIEFTLGSIKNQIYAFTVNDMFDG